MRSCFLQWIEKGGGGSGGETERMHLSICAWRQIDKFGRPDDCRAFLIATGFKFVAMQI